MRSHLLLFVVLLLGTVACRTADTARADAIPAQGLFVRHVRLRVAPAQTTDFEELMARCVAAAQVAGLPRDQGWLCYRESPGRYWIVTFSEERAGFGVPASDGPLRSFARWAADLEGPAARREVDARLAELEVELEWVLLMRQKRRWSTVEGIDPGAFPKARLMMRVLRRGEEAAFEDALARRVGFLVERGYPLPIEGFVVLEGWPGAAAQVVFPRDWPSFHERESFWQFVQHLPEAEREAYMERKGALMRTMASAEYYDADHRPKASYPVPDLGDA